MMCSVEQLLRNKIQGLLEQAAQEVVDPHPWRISKKGRFSTEGCGHRAWVMIALDDLGGLPNLNNLVLQFFRSSQKGLAGSAEKYGAGMSN